MFLDKPPNFNVKGTDSKKNTRSKRERNTNKSMMWLLLFDVYSATIGLLGPTSYI